MNSLLQDLRFGARLLAKRPGFALLAVVTLALGIGANTAIFSIINALLLRPLPINDPDRVVQVFGRTGESLSRTHSYPFYRELRDRSQTFEEVGMTAEGQVHLGTKEQAVRIRGSLVSGNYFKVLDVPPALGRLFTPDDDVTRGGHPVAVVSHSLWRRQFNSDTAVIGSEVILNGQIFTLVGVAAKGFSGTRMVPTEVWVPVSMFDVLKPDYADAGVHPLDSHEHFWLTIIGRLNPGTTIGQAEADTERIFALLGMSYPKLISPHARLVPVNDCRMGVQTRAKAVDSTRLLMVAAGLVLLIACANVASLQIVRSEDRRREMAIRTAIGGGRGRVIRQVLTESILLALIGGGAGLILAVWLADFLLLVIPESRFVSHQAIDLSPDLTVLGFTFGVAILTGVLSGFVPALRICRVNLVPALKTVTSTVGFQNKRHSLQQFFATSQVSMSVVLVIAAALLLRTWANLRQTDPGFNPRGVLLASLDVGCQGYGADRAGLFYEQLLATVEAIPGVTSAALADRVPMHSQYQRTMAVEGYEPAAGVSPMIPYNCVSSAYFSTMNITVLEGRDFTRQDSAAAPRVAVVNEAMADLFWDSEAIGKKVLGVHEVVGVVANSKYHGIREEPRPFVYFPLAQQHDHRVTLVVRTSGEPRSIGPAIKAGVRTLDPALPLYDVETLDEHLGSAAAREQMAAALFVALGLIALALVTCGLYGVISHAVVCRTREIGVRVALGAGRRNIIQLVVRQGMIVTSIGVAVGLTISLGSTRVLSSGLYGIGATDPATFVGVSLLLAAVAFVACYIPARRATRVDPMIALRCE